MQNTKLMIFKHKYGPAVGVKVGFFYFSDLLGLEMEMHRYFSWIFYKIPNFFNLKLQKMLCKGLKLSNYNIQQRVDEI